MFEILVSNSTITEEARSLLGPLSKVTYEGISFAFIKCNFVITLKKDEIFKLPLRIDLIGIQIFD
jgi:hypothetical protein